MNWTWFYKEGSGLTTNLTKLEWMYFPHSMLHKKSENEVRLLLWKSCLTYLNSSLMIKSSMFGDCLGYMKTLCLSLYFKQWQSLLITKSTLYYTRFRNISLHDVVSFCWQTKFLAVWCFVWTYFGCCCPHMVLFTVIFSAFSYVAFSFFSNYCFPFLVVVFYQFTGGNFVPKSSLLISYFTFQKRKRFHEYYKIFKKSNLIM